MLCLNIPVPKSVTALLRQPPICFPDSSDGTVIEEIRKFGKEHNRGYHKIEKACCLANGPSDFVIILERPKNGQDYCAPFDEFVRDCRTLQAVDELIRFASKGARSIDTVTVLDAFPFCPDRSPSISDKQRLGLTERILALKKPKVVLCCSSMRGDCQNLVVSQYKSLGVGTYPIRAVINQETTVIRSFHPATAVCYRLYSPYTRLLLIFHFVIAFAELTQAAGEPKWLRAVCEESEKEDDNKKMDQRHIEPWTVRWLQKSLGLCYVRSIAYPHATSGNSPGLNDVNLLLRKLFTSDSPRDALEIIRLCLFWQDYSHPQKQNVLGRLQDLGSSPTARLPFDEKETTPRRAAWHVGFADEWCDIEATQSLGSMTLDNNPSQNGDAEEISAVSQRDLLKRQEHGLAELLSRLKLSTDLQLNVFNPDTIDLSGKIAGRAREAHRHLLEATDLVNKTVDAMIRGYDEDDDEALSFDTKTPSIGHAVPNQAIRDIQSLADVAFRTCLHLSSLLAQQRLLPFETTDDGNESTDLKRISAGLENMVKDLRTALTALTAFRVKVNIEQAASEGDRRSSWYALKRADGAGLRALHNRLWEQESLGILG